MNGKIRDISFVFNFSKKFYNAQAKSNDGNLLKHNIKKLKWTKEAHNNIMDRQWEKHNIKWQKYKNKIILKSIVFKFSNI